MANQMFLTDVDAEAAVTTDGFDRVLRQQLETEIRMFPARAFYPSSLGHPCDRQLVWRFTRWQEQERHRPELQSIFDEGNLHQPSIYKRLEEMGFQVVRESDRPTQYRVKGGIISGRPDGKIVGFRGTKYKPARILEAKSMSSYQWAKIETVDDLRHAPSHWTRSYYAQGQLYCFLEDLPQGDFVLKDKGTGMLKLIPYELDYGFAEELLQRVERLAPAIQQGVDPEPIAFDPGICGGCGFRALCYPPRSFGEGATVITDALLVEDLEERERTKPDHDRYRELHESIIDRLKLLGVSYAIAGPFVIEGKVRKDGAVLYDITRTAA